jgi:hypothetical protein
MDLLRITPAELESAIAFSEIMKMEDLHEAASILASYDWDIEVLHSLCRELLVPSTSTHRLPNKNNPK